MWCGSPLLFGAPHWETNAQTAPAGFVRQSGISASSPE